MAVMMDSLQQFSCNNEFFALGIMICDDKNHYSLDRKQIRSFTYVNQINRPWLEGEIVYDDTNLMLDKFIGSKRAICMVNFNNLIHQKEGNIETYSDNMNACLCHKFMVESIDILDNPNGDAVPVDFDDDPGAKGTTYSIKLKSNFYQEFIQDIVYSNLKKGKETIIDIYRNLLQLRGFSNLAGDGGKTTTKIDYITENNETLRSSFVYLMDKLYYFGNKEDSMMFFVYDEIGNQFRFVDLEKPETYVKDIEKFPVKDVMVSRFGGSIENLESEELPIGFGMLTQTKISDTLQSLYNQVNVTYDFETNDYVTETVETNRLKNYFNSQPPTNGTPGLMNRNAADISEYNRHYNIFESNDSRIWYDQITNFMFCNGLIVNSPGQINLRPGMTLVVKITDKDPSQSKSDTVKDVKAVEDACDGIENQYFVTRVRHKIVKWGQTMMFTNNVCLAKNYDWNRKKEEKAS